jgi:TetR/AcrR family transcriptional regulator, mexJK operon transcriptional repressor
MDHEQHTRHRAGTGGEAAATKARRGPGRQTPGQTKRRNLELLDKALDLFLEKGFERTTIDGITAAVGMAKRTVYLRYGDKTGLFKASLQRAIEEWIVPVDRLRAAETDNVEETLLRIGQILVANIMRPGGLRLMRITNAESGRMPEIGAFAYTQGTAPTVAYLTDLIRRRVRLDGMEAPDPEEAAVAFLYLVVGGPASMSAWGLTLEETAIDKHTRYGVHLFLHGLLHPEHEIAGTSAEVLRPRGARKPTAYSQQVAAPSQPTASAAQDALRMQALEEENRRLKILLAESMLDVAALKDRPVG